MFAVTSMFTYMKLLTITFNVLQCGFKCGIVILLVYKIISKKDITMATELDIKESVMHLCWNSVHQHIWASYI